MKSQKVKSKALELYIGNVSIYKIARQLKVSQQTLNTWKSKGKWDKLKSDALKELDKNLCEKMIRDQTITGGLASEELAKRMIKGEIHKTDDLMKLAKHGLEVVRPKQTTNNLNIQSDKVEQLKVIIERVNPDGDKTQT